MGAVFPSIPAIEQELQRFPAAVTEEFQRARQRLEPGMTTDDLLAWGSMGVSLAQQTIRSWEVAAEYYRVSPSVLDDLAMDRFLRWAQHGEALCNQSPPVALAYFRVGRDATSMLTTEQLGAWAQMGLGLYKGTWKSSIMAARFFETSPAMLQALSFAQVGRLVGLLDTVAQQSSDLALDCLSIAAETLPRVPESSEALINLLAAVSAKSWRDTKGSLEGASKALPKVSREHRARFLSLAEKVASSGHGSVAAFMQEASQALSQLPPEAQPALLSMSEVILARRPALLTDFFRSGPMVLTRLREGQAESWFVEGLRLLEENPDAGAAFFKLESSRSEELMEALSSTVELARIKELIRMYCRALAGTTVEIASSKDLAQKGIGWVDENEPTTEGKTVFLPPTVDRHQQKDQNFEWYKVVSTHQVAHLEFESFGFLYDEPSINFRDLRPKLTPKRRKKMGLAPNQPQEAEQDGEAEQEWLTDAQKFFDLFPERRIALDIFTVLEDGRLDPRVKREYAGLRKAYGRVQQDTITDRPPLEAEGQAAQEMLIEFLLRLSLGQRMKLIIPAKYEAEARSIARVARRVFKMGTEVEDTAEGTLRVYAILAQIPNERVPQDEQTEYDDNAEQDSDQESEGESQEFLEQLMASQDQESKEEEQEKEQQQGQEGQSPDQQPYNSPKDVDYRGSFKPELVQLLNKLREGQQPQGEQQTQQIDRNQLQEMLQNNVELEAAKGDIKSSALFANNLMREAGMPQSPNMPAMGQGPFVHTDDEGGPLEAREPNTFVYDEWDFRAGDYKPRWCLVREKVVPEGESTFWRQTIAAYGPLLGQIRRQFEMMVPESFRRMKRQPDGDDFDLDSTLEAIIDKRSGVTPSDKVYWRRNKVQRDVAVALLLDMSASTAEAIDESTRGQDDWDGPNDPAEYMAWLRARRGEGARRQHKRIIDIEKESTVLLMQALSLLDDKFGIYGFSGYGRENVEFSVIKDMNETLSETVRRRMDRITPMHATRMGPAIRHATRKLELTDAKTKVLLLLSDGRPQDRGYSREGVEKEYAVHDTKRALTEARSKSITPFCLTVDKAGHDYLKTMCQDMGYEVLADIWTLPERLPYLYRRLTV